MIKVGQETTTGNQKNSEKKQKKMYRSRKMQMKSEIEQFQESVTEWSKLDRKT